MLKHLLNEFTKDELNFLNNLLDTVSPSGAEQETTRVVYDFLKNSCNLEYDFIGNLYAYKKHLIPEGIVITAHTDEVGFQITKVTETGLIYVRRLGGLDRQTMPGTMLCIADKPRELIGVFGKTSPHIQLESEKSKVIELDSLWVDFGFVNKAEALSHVSIGDYVGVIPNHRFDIGMRTCISKGLDNKISVFILAVTISRLMRKNELPDDFTAVFTVQEEIGCRGALIACQRLRPHKCICLDVGIATDIPTMNNQTSISDFNLHEGFGLCITPDNDQTFVKQLATIAIKEAIPFQYTTCYRPAAGTETSRIQLIGNGVSTAHISLPNRYMHSAVEMCSLYDSACTIKLLLRFLSESHYSSD